MITFWVFASMMTLIMSAILAVPLLERSKVKDERGFALAIYRDQLEEIDRDQKRGVLPADQAKAAQQEIKRRILALAEAPTAPAGQTYSRRLLAFVVALLPISGVAFYMKVGAPQLPGRPFAEERQAALSAPPEFVAARARAMHDPNNAAAWLAFARMALRQHRIGDSIEAFRHVTDLGKADPEIYVDYGRALVLFHDGEVSGDAKQILEKALSLNPSEPMARFLLGLRKAQQGDVDGALNDWVDLEKEPQVDTRFRAMLSQSIDKAARQLGKDPSALLDERSNR